MAEEEILGRATREGTEAWARRATEDHAFHAGHVRSFRGLRFSGLGVGTYLGEADAATDRAVEEAIAHSFASGAVNIVDTAINYRHQRAERSVGRAIARAIGEKVLRREEVFVSTKNGYLAPDAESGLSPREYVQQELIGTGALSPADIVDGSHAMSVPYLRDQLGRSLENLSLGTVDLLYLHNAPEAQLEAVGRRSFLERLEAAFAFFEEARKKTRIGWYGLATWDSLRKGRSEPGYLSLEETVEVARKVGGEDHGFRFIQFPLNLVMPEAAQLRNQTAGGERLTLIEAAHRLEIGTFSSVPLLQGQLAQGASPVPGLTSSQAALQFTRSAPHHLAPLVGQKATAHVRENLKVAQLPPLPESEFRRMID